MLASLLHIILSKLTMFVLNVLYQSSVVMGLDGRLLVKITDLTDIIAGYVFQT